MDINPPSSSSLEVPHRITESSTQMKLTYYDLKLIEVQEESSQISFSSKLEDMNDK